MCDMQSTQVNLSYAQEPDLRSTNHYTHETHDKQFTHSNMLLRNSLRILRESKFIYESYA
jgi:hypothetical protein